MKQKFDITGMTCSACANHVEKAVNKLPGTNNTNVNLMQNVLQIDYDNTQTTPDDIKQAVEHAGYGISEQGKIEVSSKDNKLEKAAHDMKVRLTFSIILLIPLMYISMGHMLGLPLPDFLSGLHNAITYAMVQFLITLIIIYLNRSYFINGFRALIHRAPSMDSLIAIGSSAALLYGIYAIIQMGLGLAYQDWNLVEQYHMDLYFESAGTIVTLITVGKYLESRSKGKTNDAIKKLMDLSPKVAIVERNGKEMEVAIEEVVKDDIIIVKSGSTIPVDGVIIEGSATINEAAITGESLPIEKTINANVTGGTISVSGFFKMQATRVGEDTTLSQIIKLVEDANASKAPIAKLADKVSGVFVPIVIAIAIIATITWLLLGYSVSFSLSIGIAVLIISCPCALGLATPTAIMVGTGKGAEYGILFKTAESLESMKNAEVVVLDKTGTVTKGKPIVTDIVVNDSISEKELLQIALNIENASEHPLAQAISTYAKEKNLEAQKLDTFEQIPGQGIKASQNGKQYLAGNEKMMKAFQVNLEKFSDTAAAMANIGKTPLYFCEDNHILGLIALADTVKENSKQAIQELQNMGIDVVLLTGDNKKTAQAIANQVGVHTIISDVLPQEKEKHIREIKAQNKHVIMVGDGINDAPALARADVGLAIGAGTDIAIDSADVVLMKSDLLDVVTAIQLSHATIRNIKQNLFWAFIYNTIGIPIAAGLFYPAFNLTLNPMLGSAAMSLSSLFVVSNALRLRFFKPNTNNRIKVKTTKGETRVMKKIMYIDGMSCKHCEGRVNEALNTIDGVDASVDLDNNLANITLHKDVSDDTLKNAVEDAGYTVTSIKAG
ncbi:MULTISPECIES: heavy metal translocating P-type ATPase [unclassified Breznakia]|uniref:heavy metal translocating P-type ATPase n=1 Tax=unclassified Breznakia TaxID=2623764 RepID=UPI0024056652|nr:MULTISPECIES: heavy metal translocating P-type ATPase [unclassified Breznakia]MDF9837809.1 Cu+-exporting ATPase [Breznakia sp. PFB2-8]MDF9859729.1 Cu+-exporting ATPase [Breznakia sp. PH5-24]